ncbi:hypothetical protein DFS34DRAFT_614864 [Phlyctochytrium arcticum]|nr:hypothetical protein DFS34DRAFT_614864 [Phlyctochytrium arcticum]
MSTMFPPDSTAWVSYVVGTSAIFVLSASLGMLFDIFFLLSASSQVTVLELDSSALVPQKTTVAQGDAGDADRIAFLTNRLEELEKRLKELEALRSVAAPPPPPPPPPPAINAPYRKAPSASQESKPKDSLPQEASMSDVLKELSRVQKTFTRLMSPRKKYLNKRFEPMAPSPLRKAAATRSSLNPSDNPFSPSLPRKSEAVANMRSLSAVINKAYRPSSNLSSSLAVEGQSPLAQAAEDDVAPVVPEHSVNRNPIRRTPDINIQTQDEFNSESSRPDFGHPKLATSVRLPMQNFAPDVALTRLKKTNIPRSPGGTTLIPQRRTPSKSTNSPQDTLLSLKEKFQKAYGQNEEIESRLDPLSLR